MRNLNYFVQVQLLECANGEILEIRNGEEAAKKQALEKLHSMPDKYAFKPAWMGQHFTMLNCSPVVVGTRWMIDEETYDYCHNLMLPKFRMNGGFYCSEEITDGIYSAYYRDDNGTYWHEFERP